MKEEMIPNLNTSKNSYSFRVTSLKINQKIYLNPIYYQIKGVPLPD